MDTLSLKLFLKVAKLGALSLAARDLSLSPASASARLAKLEQETGFRLFNRTTRAVSLTTDGAAFLPYAQTVIETLESGLNITSGKGDVPKGILRMAMPGSFGRMHVIPTLREFQQQYPLIKLDLKLSDQIQDVVEGAFDLIIRNAPLADSSLVARKLAADNRILVASPSYLAKYGEPESPQELQSHQIVDLHSNSRFKFADGQRISPATTYAVNDGEAMRIMLENGMGIGMKSVWNAYQGLNAGKLVQVLTGFPLETNSAIWALYPSGRLVSPKVRAMIDFLLGKFQPIPPWQLTPKQDSLV